MYIYHFEEVRGGEKLLVICPKDAAYFHRSESTVHARIHTAPLIVLQGSHSDVTAAYKMWDMDPFFSC